MSTNRRTMREESFDSIHSSEISNDTTGDETSTADELEEETSEPKLMTLRDVREAVHPLQATADRVGRQVELFAETLDRLAQRDQPDTDDCRRVLPLVCGFEKVSLDTVKSLAKDHSSERIERLKDTWRQRLRRTSGVRSRSSSRKGSEKRLGDTSVEDLQDWDEEYQTWKLFRLMLQTQYPVKDRTPALPNQEERYHRPDSDKRIHQYSSEQDIWASFLGDFDDVWEKNLVVEWLKDSANGTAKDVGQVIEEVEREGQEGGQLSASGWLDSREAIKKQKRLRSWPQPLEPGSPGLDSSHVNKDRTKRLVTQLDPDAVSRQDRGLELGEVGSERTTWLGCWELLRRGESWDKIRDFCQEREQGWQALSIRGDPRLASAGSNKRDAVQQFQSRSLWRNMCLRAAKGGGLDEYECAVYGLLCGDLESSEAVVKSWDDYLFALYNSQLLNQFDFYIQKKLSNRLPQTVDPKSRQLLLIETRPPNLSGEEAWQSLLTFEATREEAREPMKMLQGSLIAGSAPRYLREQGFALATTAQEPIGDEDYNFLRILAHMVLVFVQLGSIEFGDPPTTNIVSAYIDFLGHAGKLDLLPLYASCLTLRAAIDSLARQLPKIVDSGERQRFIRLASKYDIEPVQILRQQLIHLAQTAQSDPNTSDFPKLDMLEFPQPGSYEVPKIKAGFMSDELTEQQVDLIHGVEWYLLLEHQWPETMWAGALVHKFFLLNGAFAAARELTRRVSFSFVSLEKTASLFGRKMDLAVEQLEDDHPSSEFYNEVLLTSSDTFRGLESLVFALDALESWKEVADQLDEQTDPRHARAWKSKLQDAHDLVVGTVEPLMHKWLQQPADDEERETLETIRTTYLPDIVLSYISVLHFDGHHLSRDILLKIMNLAVDIAGPGGASTTRRGSDGTGGDDNPDNLSEVCAAFRKVGRMAQLVEALTASSLSVMRADQTAAGKKKGKGGQRRKSGPGGENLDIWNVKLPRV